jgi:GT2 family glycosyltransferase/glycosyltransferase involved in cell wall biosynthesis
VRIGIDAREIQGQATGVGRYLRGLLEHWPTSAQDELVLYLDGRPVDLARWRRPGVTLRVLDGAGRGLVWQERLLPRAVRADDLQVFFAPAYWCPLRLELPRVTAVHDLSFFRLPEDFHWREGWRRRLLVSASLDASAHVLTISEFSRREILGLRPDLSGRVTVTPLGADDDLPAAPARVDARTRLALEGPFLLTVGSLFNRRRLPELLRATARLRQAWPGLRLEIIGDNRTQPRVDLDALVSTLGLGSCVRLSGFLDEEALATRYAAADLAVFLSVYEGFGLPAMEAASRGVPLVVSHRPALSEVFGSAAVLVDPEHVDALAHTLDRLLSSPSERAALGARARALARRHVWADTARRTREVLAGVARAPRPRDPRRPTAVSTPASPGVHSEVAAILVSHNTRDDLLAALASLACHDPRPSQVWVVDNASTDGSPAAVRAHFPEVRLIANAVNVGFGVANNQALAQVQTPFVLLLNPDAELQPGALRCLLDALHAEAGLALVGPRTRHADGTAQVSFGPALGLLAEWRQRRLVNGVRRRDPLALAQAERLSQTARDPEWLSASCWLARTEALRAEGGFDPAFFLYEEDVDLCLRLRRAGWRLGYRPSAQVVHRSGRSMARRPALARLAYQRSHLHYYRRHCGALATFGLRLLLSIEALSALLLGRGPSDAEMACRAYGRALMGLLWRRVR